MFNDLLLPMFDDEYYPDILVAEVKQLIERFAKKLAKKVKHPLIFLALKVEGKIF